MVLYLLTSNSIEKVCTDDLPQYDGIQILAGEIPIGTYDSLVYNLINVTRGRPSGSAASGVTTASSPYCDLTSAQQSLTSDIASFAVASPYNSLELLDFYFGCILHSAQELNAADAAATQCTITVTVFLRDTYQEAEPATYEFSPPGGLMLPIPMNHAVLPVRFQQPLFSVTLTRCPAR